MSSKGAKPRKRIAEVYNHKKQKIMKEGVKKIAVISTFTRMVKFYNPDGSRDMNNPDGFYNSKDLDFYKENYIVKFSN